MTGAKLTDRLGDFPLQFVQLGDRRQGYRCAGESGPYVVLLHGISSGSGSWVCQLQSLAGAGFKVIAWDAPGYGHSDPLLSSRPTATDYAERLLLLLDKLQIQSATLVGHSLGALQASAFAATYPERVDSLVLASPAQGYGQESDAKKAEVFAKRPGMFKRLGPVEMARERAPALLSPSADDDKIALVADGMRKLRLEGFSAASWLLAHDDIWRYLDNWQDNLLVMCGNEDEITPPAGAKALAQRATESLYLELPGGGHAVYIDTPEPFSSAVAGYIHIRHSGSTWIPGGKR